MYKVFFNEKLIVITHPDIITLFKSIFTFVKAAGGVVWRDDKLLFIFRDGKWDLPKGKADDGETIENTAIREVEEECGISNLQIVKKLSSTFHIYKSPHSKLRNEYIFKETVWFEMSYSGNDLGTPQSDEGITELRWLNRSELNLVLDNTYENIKEIILYFCRME